MLHAQAYTDRKQAILNNGWFVSLLFFLATIAYLWPQATHMATALPDGLDSTDTARQLGEIAHNLLHDPLHIYNSPGLYPLNNDLALNELLIGQGIVIAPVIWLTGNPILAWNILTFLSFFLSAVAAWLLVRRFTGSSLAGIAAGITYAFSPWHYGQYGHLGIMAIPYMVFGLYFLVLFLDRSRTSQPLLDRRNLLFLVLFAAFTAFQALSAGYYGYYAAILYGLYFAYYLLKEVGMLAWLSSLLRKQHPSTINWRRLLGQVGLLAIGGVFALATIYPFLRPYSDFKTQFGFNRALEEVEYWSAGLISFFRTTVTSFWYDPVQRGIFGLETSAEREMYPGIVAVLLSLSLILFALIRRRQPKEPIADNQVNQQTRFPMPFVLAVVLVGLILSFGPTLHTDSYAIGSTGIPLPYRWLYQYVPGFDALRVPHRFDIFIMLGLGALAGYALVQLGKWAGSNPARSWLPLAALALLMIDFFAPGLHHVDVPIGNDAPPLYRWLDSNESLATVPADAIVIELPVGQDKTPVNTSPQYLFYNLPVGRPMLNGSPNIIPAGYERLFSEMRRFPSPGTLDIIEGLGAKFVVVHTGGLLSDDKRAALAKEAAPGGRLQLLQSFPDDWHYPPDSKAEVYRLIPQPSRLAKLKAAIPEGSSVLLADHPAHLRLYNTALPNLLGQGRQYFSDYSTIYDTITPPRQPAAPGQSYDFVVIYAGDDPSRFGVSAQNKIDIGDNDQIEVYKR